MTYPKRLNSGAWDWLTKIPKLKEFKVRSCFERLEIETRD